MDNENQPKYIVPKKLTIRLLFYFLKSFLGAPLVLLKTQEVDEGKVSLNLFGLLVKFDLVDDADPKDIQQCSDNPDLPNGIGHPAI